MAEFAAFGTAVGVIAQVGTIVYKVGKIAANTPAALKRLIMDLKSYALQCEYFEMYFAEVERHTPRMLMLLCNERLRRLSERVARVGDRINRALDGDKEALAVVLAKTSGGVGKSFVSQLKKLLDQVVEVYQFCVNHVNAYQMRRMDAICDLLGNSGLTVDIPSGQYFNPGLERIVAATEEIVVLEGPPGRVPLGSTIELVFLVLGDVDRVLIEMQTAPRITERGSMKRTWRYMGELTEFPEDRRCVFKWQVPTDFLNSHKSHNQYFFRLKCVLGEAPQDVEVGDEHESDASSLASSTVSWNTRDSEAFGAPPLGPTERSSKFSRFNPVTRIGESMDRAAQRIGERTKKAMQALTVAKCKSEKFTIFDPDRELREAAAKEAKEQAAREHRSFLARTVSALGLGSRTGDEARDADGRERSPPTTHRRGSEDGVSLPAVETVHPSRSDPEPPTYTPPAVAAYPAAPLAASAPARASVTPKIGAWTSMAALRREQDEVFALAMATVSAESRLSAAVDVGQPTSPPAARLADSQDDFSEPPPRRQAPEPPPRPPNLVPPTRPHRPSDAAAPASLTPPATRTSPVGSVSGNVDGQHRPTPPNPSNDSATMSEPPWSADAAISALQKAAPPPPTATQPSPRSARTVGETGAAVPGSAPRIAAPLSVSEPALPGPHAVGSPRSAPADSAADADSPPVRAGIVSALRREHENAAAAAGDASRNAAPPGYRHWGNSALPPRREPPKK